ncbi:MAG TPA: hypothetical protein VF290_28790 [Pyrinomonadaceae bacterium]
MKQFLLVSCLLFTATVTKAQVAKTAPQPKSAAMTEEELKARQRRVRARALLVSLSTDARTFQDLTLRARSLARIADALWPVDAEQGRLLFRKAWEAAEVADQESDRKQQEEINRQKARTGGGFAVETPPNLRREVLKLAARHDRILGEEFLEKLKTEAANTVTSRSPSARLTESQSQRIELAKELLQTDDIERALQFAGPALTVVSQGTIVFLVELRAKNAAAADAAYSALLTSSALNPQADANSVSMLSSYIFTPQLFVTFSGTGVATSQTSATITPANVTPELRNAFFQAAAAILLRPLPAPGQQDQSPSDLNSKYMVIKRMLPLFEQSAPAEMVELLRGQLNALNAIVSDNTRQRDDEWVNKGIKPDKPAEEREQELLDRIDRAKTSEERDRLYLQLVFLALSKGEMRARDLVSKVEDAEQRKQAQTYVDVTLTAHFVSKKQPDQALELIRKGDLSHIHKAWALSECAKLLDKTDHQKALDLIDDAADEARRIEGSDPAAPRALVAVANAVKVVAPERVWDATFDAVKAANSAEGFTGEDGRLVMKFEGKGQRSIRTDGVSEFNLDGIFRDLATRDYDRAVELARGFQGEGPRAVATIAIARAILEPKKK